MKLVVDSNIVISALIANKGKTRELIQHPSLELYAPEQLQSEINKHKELIKEKIEWRGGNPNTLTPLLLRIYNQIIIVPKKEYESNLEKTKNTLKEHYEEVKCRRPSNIFGNFTSLYFLPMFLQA